MIALRLGMLLVAVALIYVLFLKSATKTEGLPPDLVQSATPGASPAPSTSPAHSQYKAALDRAHDAAKQMREQHAEPDSY